MSDFFGGIGDWFGGVGDTIGGWFDGGGDGLMVLDDPGTFTDESGGTDLYVLDDPGTGFDESMGADWYNPNAESPELADGLLGNDAGGNTGFGGVQSTSDPAKAAGKTQSPLWKQAASIVGQTAAGLLRSGVAGTGTGSGTVNNILQSAPKVSPMATTGPQAMGRGNGPAATVGGTDAITAWTKLFSGNH